MNLATDRIRPRTTAAKDIRVKAFNAQQRKGADSYTKPQLDLIARNAGAFTYSRMAEGDASVARRILAEQVGYNLRRGNLDPRERPSFRGYVVGLTSYDPQQPRLSPQFDAAFKPWLDGLPGYPQ